MKCIAFILSLLVVFASCSTGTTPPNQPESEVLEVSEPSAPSVLTVGVETLPNEYDPITTGLENVSPLFLACYEGLFAYDTSSGAIVPGLAEGYAISEDGLVYTFRLRENAKYSSGVTIVADDFVDTIFRILDGEGDPVLREKLAGLIVGGSDYILPSDQRPEGFDKDSVGVYSVSGTELTIELVRPASELLQLLTLPALAPTYRDDDRAQPVSKPSEEEPMGALFESSGPYYIVNEDDSGITVRRNNHYYGMLDLATDTMRFSELNDDSIFAFNEGRLDIIADPTEDMLNQLSGDVYTTSTFDTLYLAFNVEDLPTRTTSVRAAVNFSIDREELVDTATFSAVAANGIVAPGVAFTNEDYSDYPERNSLSTTFEPEKVEQELINARYRDGVGLRLTMVVDATDPYIETYRQVSEMIETNTGASLEFFVLSDEEYAETIEDDKFDITAGYIKGDILNPASMMAIAKSNSSQNISGYYDSTFDNLLNAASTMTNFTNTQEAFREAETHLIANTSFSPLLHMTQDVIVSQNADGWYMNAVGNLYVKNAYCIMEEGAE